VSTAAITAWRDGHARSVSRRFPVDLLFSLKYLPPLFFSGQLLLLAASGCFCSGRSPLQARPPGAHMRDG